MILKNILPAVFLLCCQFWCSGQQVGIGTKEPHPYAVLDISDSLKGLLIPRLDSVNLHKIPNIPGMMLFDKTSQSFFINNGLEWQKIMAAGQSVNREARRLRTLIYLSGSF